MLCERGLLLSHFLVLLFSFLFPRALRLLPVWRGGRVLPLRCARLSVQLALKSTRNYLSLQLSLRSAREGSSRHSLELGCRCDCLLCLAHICAPPPRDGTLCRVSGCIWHLEIEQSGGRRWLFRERGRGFVCGRGVC